MIRNKMYIATSLLAGLGLAAGVTGCRVHVDKGANGDHKSVQVDTPFGDVHVNTDQTSATDLGLPVYPGARQVKNEDEHESADVHLGFGEWKLRVRVVSYVADDSKENVTAFYRKALGRYGDVIACRGDEPVGTPAATSEGLTCSDSRVNTIQNDRGTANNELDLKAGSKRHQHIVRFDKTEDGETTYSLVALDLPAESGGNSAKSD